VSPTLRQWPLLKFVNLDYFVSTPQLVPRHSSNAFKLYPDCKNTNGLVSDYVYATAIDAQANMWFGTSSGVSKFDGTNWINYTKSNSGFPGNQANAIAVDLQGNIWFGTDYGVSKFDGTNWTNYMTSDYVSVPCITFNTNGHLWIGATGGSKGQLLEYDGTSWKSYFINYLATNLITCIAIESSGIIWVGTSYGGLSKFDGTNLTTYTTSNSGLAHDHVYSIAIDAQGNKWIATGGGVSIFDNTNWTTYPLYGLRSIAIDAIGNVWVASTGWVSKFDSGDWIIYDDPSSIAIEFRGIATDSFGNKWFGSYGNGVFNLEVISTNIVDPKSEGQKWNKILAYPNPSVSESTLLFPYSDKFTLIITDMKGIIVKQFSELNNDKIKISTNDMKPGIYSLLLKSTSNGKSYKGKIVVTK
jgi:streptogramin lyase